MFKEKLSRYGNKNRTDENSFDAKPKKDFYNDDNFGSLSEIASCSYEARACGIHNGMFMGPALKLCPDLHTIPYDFEAYKDVAYTLYDTIARFVFKHFGYHYLTLIVFEFA